MSATDRKVQNASGVDILVPIDAQLQDKKETKSFNIVVIASHPQYKPRRLAAAPVVQVPSPPVSSHLIT